MKLDTGKLGTALGRENKQALNGNWEDAAEFQGCCDCGLVHRMEYRIKLPSGEILVMPEGTMIQIRSYQEPELTKQARESQNFSCSLQRRGK